ncbi:hypothetical protein JF540_23005, partial [Salipiger thiooxidans]|nr:hypothetical protein [Salipiger thiooxidans]
MADGIRVPDKGALASADSFLAVYNGTTGLLGSTALATLMAGSGVLASIGTTDALAARITALEDQAFAESPIYETTAAGIAATGEGDRFRVENAAPEIAYDIYDHDPGGVATFVTDIPAGSALATKLTTSNALSELVGVAATARANIGAAAQTALTDTAGRINYMVSGIAGTGDAVTCNLADTSVGGAAVSLTRGMVLRDFPWP